MLCGGSVLQGQSSVGSIQGLWEKWIWEGGWPFLDPVGIVCAYAQHPWSGTCQGSTGRMASSFFFLIQKEPATMPGSETFSPFFALLTSARLFSLLMSSRSARLSARSQSRKREELNRVVVELLIQETCGETAAQRVQCGKVRMKHGLRTKAFHRVFLAKTMCATVRCTSLGCMGLVTRSFSSWRIESLRGWH